MDTDYILFSSLLTASLGTVILFIARSRPVPRGWVAVNAGVLLLTLIGWSVPVVLYVAFAAWSVFVVVPIVLVRICQRYTLRQQFTTARRIAGVIGWLHPADGMRESTRIITGFEMAQRGDSTAARETLLHFRATKSPFAIFAVARLYGLLNQWEDLAAWLADHQREIDRSIQYLPLVLRMRAELGDTRGMLEEYGKRQQQLAKLPNAAFRDVCRMFVFSFCGKRRAVERLFEESLSSIPRQTRAFWLATADLTAGEMEIARKQFEQLLPDADPMLRIAIERRLADTTDRSARLSADDEQLLCGVATEHGHEVRFSTWRSPLSARARATQILVLINVVVFAAEVWQGGGSNLEVLYQMGAMFAPAVWEGEWWRLVAPLFLHLGAWHLMMNMFGLCLFGPYTEYALGRARFLLVYLAAGIGSAAVVMAIDLLGQEPRLMVGASGCIMGLAGAILALTLRGWRREGAAAAKRRLRGMLGLVALQTVFDWMTPCVSMTAHLSGAIIGFAVTMIVGEKSTRQSNS